MKTQVIENDRDQRLGLQIVTMTISKQRIVDLFVGACEGGSGYWCSKLRPSTKVKSGEDQYEAMLRGFWAVDMERADDTPITVTPTKIEQAIRTRALKYGRHFGNWMSENDDAETADVFLQLCVHGDVLYG